MMKTFVLLFCLSVTLGAGYSASDVTTTATATTTMKPTSESTTAKSTSGSTTAKPTSGSTTAKSTTGSTTAKSTTGSTTAKSTTGSTTAKSTTGSTTAKSTTGSTTAKSTTGSTTAKSTTGSTTAKSTTGSTTAKSTTGSTTAKPTTGSTTAKSTAPPPTTAPPPYGNFSLKKNGNYCLLAQFAVTFTIHYPAKVREDNGSKTMDKNATIFLNRTNSHNVNISGVCGEKETEEKLILSWPKKKPFYNLTMEFATAKATEANKQSGEKWRVQMIYLHIKMDGNPTFSNATEKSFTSFFNGSSGPSYKVGGYYSCMSEDKNRKFEAPNNYTVDPVFEDVKLEPFVAKNTSNGFGNEKFPCYQDSPTSVSTPTTKPSNNDIVPIAVGCALAGLVLIVLIAYIIGRRKSHRGYEKV